MLKPANSSQKEAVMHGEPRTRAYVLTAHDGTRARMRELLGNRLLSQEESPYIMDGTEIQPNPEANHRVLMIVIQGTTKDLQKVLYATGGYLVGEATSWTEKPEEIGFADECPEEKTKEPAGEEQIVEIQHAVKQRKQPELDPSIEHYDQP